MMASKKHILAVLLMMAGSFPIAAQDMNDFGTWADLMAIKIWKNQKEGPSPFAALRAEHRSFRNVSKMECYFLAAAGGCIFNKYLQADVGYEFWRFPDKAVSTFHKGTASVTGTIGCGNLAFSLRERYELAYGVQSHSSSHLLRSKIRGQYSIPKIRLTPYLMYEIFASLTGGGWIRSLHYAGTEFAFGKHSSIDVFYMYHLYSLNNLANGEHVAGLGYNFIF